MKQLIVVPMTLDAPGVNRGILEAYEAGIVTSTTVMINYRTPPPAWSKRSPRRPTWALACINLTAGYRVLPAGASPRS